MPLLHYWVLICDTIANSDFDFDNRNWKLILTEMWKLWHPSQIAKLLRPRSGPHTMCNDGTWVVCSCFKFRSWCQPRANQINQNWSRSRPQLILFWWAGSGPDSGQFRIIWFTLGWHLAMPLPTTSMARSRRASAIIHCFLTCKTNHTLIRLSCPLCLMGISIFEHTKKLD